MLNVTTYASPLGRMLLCTDAEGLCGLWFCDQKGGPQGLVPNARACDVPVLAETCRWLDIYFGGECPAFTPALHLTGSPFRRAVQELMLGIPYGGTATYGELARRLAEKMGRPAVSAQAVGGAVGHNEISLIIPCHRVVGVKGKLTGYAAGLERKAYLLSLESPQGRFRWEKSPVADRRHVFLQNFA